MTQNVPGLAFFNFSSKKLTFFRRNLLLIRSPLFSSRRTLTCLSSSSCAVSLFSTEVKNYSFSPFFLRLTLMLDHGFVELSQLLLQFFVLLSHFRDKLSFLLLLRHSLLPRSSWAFADFFLLWSHFLLLKFISRHFFFWKMSFTWRHREFLYSSSGRKKCFQEKTNSSAQSCFFHCLADYQNFNKKKMIWEGFKYWKFSEGKGAWIWVIPRIENFVKLFHE